MKRYEDGWLYLFLTFLLFAIAMIYFAGDMKWNNPFYSKNRLCFLCVIELQ